MLLLDSTLYRLCVCVSVYIHVRVCMHAGGWTNHSHIWGGLKNLRFSVYSLLFGLDWLSRESLRFTYIHLSFTLALQVETTTPGFHVGAELRSLCLYSQHYPVSHHLPSPRLLGNTFLSTPSPATAILLSASMRPIVIDSTLSENLWRVLFFCT